MTSNLIALQNKFLGQGQTVYDRLAEIKHRLGYIDHDAIAQLALQFNLPPQHVRSTAKFYDALAQDKPARHTVQICNGEACRAAGCASLDATLRQRLTDHAAQHNGQSIRLEHVTCLGYCGQGPNATVDGQPVSLAHPQTIDHVLAHVHDVRPHNLPEPQNKIYPPPKDSPCVLLRHAHHDVRSLAAARDAGIYHALEKAVRTMTPQQVIDHVKQSQLRGRGGAGFPTGIKFQTVADSPTPDNSNRKFIVVNFDEGDAGSYIDKELIERDPHTQLEGILLAAYACGAQQAIIYARLEYPRARQILSSAIAEARDAGLIGKPLFNSSFSCDIKLVCGQGAYICGEETSLLRSLEGLPALVSVRPPFPAQQGLWDCPTAVNNVETLHNLPWIIDHGPQAYAALGHNKSRGTKAVSLNTRVKNPGVYEVEFGTTLRQIIFDIAGGMADGQAFKAVQIGGPLGGILPEHLLDTPLDFEALAAVSGIVGHAGIVVYSSDDNLVEICRGLMAFCAVESCGKCFPCRIGSVRGTELFDQIITQGLTDDRLTLLTDLLETMKLGSLCALGGMTPLPVECLIKYFPHELERYRTPR
jgi:NADH:ubiquinone oxidoreductase subunit F (NADH-binding)/NADH:ubiquinone oxidoreductase subunit E